MNIQQYFLAFEYYRETVALNRESGASWIKLADALEFSNPSTTTDPPFQNSSQCPNAGALLCPIALGASASVSLDSLVRA
jgi:hypothetical protein